jgi:hypothetical protein
MIPRALIDAQLMVKRSQYKAAKSSRTKELVTQKANNIKRKAERLCNAA